MNTVIERKYEAGDIVYLEHIFYKNGKFLKEYKKGTVVAYKLKEKTWFSKAKWEYLMDTGTEIIRAKERWLWGSEEVSIYSKALNFNNGQ